MAIESSIVERLHGHPALPFQLEALHANSNSSNTAYAAIEPLGQLPTDNGSILIKLVFSFRKTGVPCAGSANEYVNRDAGEYGRPVGNQRGSACNGWHDHSG